MKFVSPGVRSRPLAIASCGGIGESADESADSGLKYGTGPDAAGEGAVGGGVDAEALHLAGVHPGERVAGGRVPRALQGVGGGCAQVEHSDQGVADASQEAPAAAGGVPGYLGEGAIAGVAGG